MFLFQIYSAQALQKIDKKVETLCKLSRKSIEAEGMSQRLCDQCLVRIAAIENTVKSLALR